METRATKATIQEQKTKFLQRAKIQKKTKEQKQQMQVRHTVGTRTENRSENTDERTKSERKRLKYTTEGRVIRGG